MKRKLSKPLLLAGAILGAGIGFVYAWNTGQLFGWKMVAQIIFLAVLTAMAVDVTGWVVIRARSSAEDRRRALWGVFSGVFTGLLLLFFGYSLRNILLNTFLLSMLFAWLLVDNREGQRLSLRAAVLSILAGGLAGLFLALFLGMKSGGELLVFIGALAGFLSARTIDFFFFS